MANAHPLEVCDYLISLLTDDQQRRALRSLEDIADLIALAIFDYEGEAARLERPLWRPQPPEKIRDAFSGLCS